MLVFRRLCFVPRKPLENHPDWLAFTDASKSIRKISDRSRIVIGFVNGVDIAASDINVIEIFPNRFFESVRIRSAILEEAFLLPARHVEQQMEFAATIHLDGCKCRYDKAR